jgi:hypothetical protein
VEFPDYEANLPPKPPKNAMIPEAEISIHVQESERSSTKKLTVSWHNANSR